MLNITLVANDMAGEGMSESEVGVVVERLLRAVREHLGLEVAFVGEVADGRRTFRFVDSGDEPDIVWPGASDPSEASYCAHVLSGDLPRFLRDPSDHPVAASLPVTAELPVGTHLSVPIRFSDGRVYGTFCCFSREVSDSISPDDLRAVSMMAELAGEYIESLEDARREESARRQRIEAILADDSGIAIVFQPIFDLDEMKVVGAEALARFADARRPDLVFAEAESVGLGRELELKAARCAFETLDRLPSGLRLNVNVSPATLASPEFAAMVESVEPGRVVVEVTEHDAVDDYTALKAASARLSSLGVSLAIDDVGMGFSGLNRILETSPQKLKLDAVVIRNVDTDPVKQALIEAFCSFGKRVGFEIVAEGIETAAELATLRRMRVQTGQGYFLGRPMPLEDIVGLAPQRCAC